MEGPILMQDWLTMLGQGAHPGEATFVCNRDSILWLGDAQGAVLAIDIADVTAATTAPALQIETAAGEAGPWSVVESYTSAGSHALFLKRDPTNATTVKPFLGYIRWSIAEDSGGSGNWSMCFRIVVVVEPAR